jgi:hypothetical protein
LGCLLIFIPTSLLSKLSGVGVAGHSGTGGISAKGTTECIQTPISKVCGAPDFAERFSLQ